MTEAEYIRIEAHLDAQIAQARQEMIALEGKIDALSVAKMWLFGNMKPEINKS